MSKYSRQHYRNIATLLRKGKASTYEINKWCKNSKEITLDFQHKFLRIGL